MRFYPPNNNSVGTSFRRIWSVVDFARLPHGAECLLVYRHYSAGRHRQKNGIMMVDFAIEAQREQGKHLSTLFMKPV
jgi:hypothetical protein